MCCLYFLKSIDVQFSDYGRPWIRKVWLLLTLTFVAMGTSSTNTRVVEVAINTGGTTGARVSRTLIAVKNCQQIMMLDVALCCSQV